MDYERATNLEPDQESWLFDTFKLDKWEEKGWDDPNVRIKIINDTGLELSRTKHEGELLSWTQQGARDSGALFDNLPPRESTSSASLPAETISARKGIYAAALSGKVNNQVEGRLNYKPKNSGSGNICDIGFNNDRFKDNVADVKIAKEWYNQNYRLYYRLARNKSDLWITVLIRKIEFPNQKSSVRGQNVTMTDSPGATISNMSNQELIFCFYQGERKALWFKVLGDSSNGSNFREWNGSDHRVPGTTLGWSPSAVEFQGKIYIFYHGVTDGQVWYNAITNIRLNWQTNAFEVDWQGDRSIPKVGLSNGPSAAVFQNRIYVVYRGTKKDDPLYYCSFDGSNWTQDAPLPNNQSLESPSIVVFRNKLFCFYHGIVPNGSVYWDEFDGTKWRGSQIVPGTTISSSPSAVVAGDKIYLFHQGGFNSPLLWCNVYDGNTWSGEHDFPDVRLVNGPDACAKGNTIYVFHQGATKGELWVMPLPV